ncbi:hypothetical protein MAFF211271_05570 [Ralstonia syzygii subsp. indonesiensis]|nr:hypothetical protein MAFF211271_05570 [Ralstonia pseudosolanacearum]
MHVFGDGGEQDGGGHFGQGGFRRKAESDGWLAYGMRRKNREIIEQARGLPGACGVTSAGEGLARLMLLKPLTYLGFLRIIASSLCPLAAQAGDGWKESHV